MTTSPSIISGRTDSSEVATFPAEPARAISAPLIPSYDDYRHPADVFMTPEESKVASKKRRSEESKEQPEGVEILETLVIDEPDTPDGDKCSYDGTEMNLLLVEHEREGCCEQRSKRDHHECVGYSCHLDTEGETGSAEAPTSDH